MISQRDRRFLRKAVDIAHSSTQKKKHGAVVVKSGSVLSVGVNTFRNNPNNVCKPKEEASIHAEVAALKSAPSTTGVTVYVARTNRDYEPLISMPCVYCFKALNDAGVKRIVWTTGKTSEPEEIVI